MFMRENRKKNNAPQPEQVASKDASAQRAARQLSPNDLPTEDGIQYKFTPDMSSPAAINSAHYQGGVSGNGPYGKSYEDKIPSIGKPNELGRNKLKG